MSHVKGRHRWQAIVVPAWPSPICARAAGGRPAGLASTHLDVGYHSLPNQLAHMHDQLSWKVSLRGKVTSLNGKAAGLQGGLDSADTVRRL
jgi:hypothetical protein